MRTVIVSAVAAAAIVASPSIASAQAGVGLRMAWVTADTNVETDKVRFTGGQVRVLSPRWGLEVSLDHHSTKLEAVNQKISETPIQMSVMLRTGSKVSPYFLAGPGWYRRKVELIEGPGDAALSTTEFGWHAGVGLEALPGRHLGIHGDYRYTFLDFGKDDDEGFIGGLIPGHRGSMWTLGFSVYF